MKRDKLYRVTKGNLFALGDQIQTTGLSVSGTPTFADYGYDKVPNIPKIDLSKYYKPKNSFFSNQSVQQGLGFAANMADQIPTGDKRGLYDTLDPLYHLAGGKESAVGNGLSDVGVGLFKTGASSGNGALMLAGAIAKSAGGVYNTLFGTKWDEDLIKKIEGNTATMNAIGKQFGNINDSASFFDTAGRMSSGLSFDYNDLGSTGWLKGNGKLKKKSNELHNAQGIAEAYQLRGMSDAAIRANEKLEDLAIANTPSFAEGGSLIGLNNNNNMGAIEYGLASDYLTYKKRQADNKNTMTNMFAGMPGTILANGGYMNPNMGDTDMDNIFKKGGKIHIKKSHQGRLTELKKRTGKTEAELWAEGKPEVKKMITFARNSRRWSKHAFGGYLKGNIYDIPEEEVNRLIAAGYEVEYL